MSPLFREEIKKFLPYLRYKFNINVCLNLDRVQYNSALRAGADDPDRSAMGSRMKALVGELTKKEASKATKAVASKELAKLREAYEQRLFFY